VKILLTCVLRVRRTTDHSIARALGRSLIHDDAEMLHVRAEQVPDRMEARDSRRLIAQTRTSPYLVEQARGQFANQRIGV
jgi:hypothetical protein